VVLEVASGTGRIVPRQLLGRRYAAAARRVVALGLLPMRAEVTRAGGTGAVVAVGPTGERPLGSAVTLAVAVAPVAAAPVAAPTPAAPAPSATSRPTTSSSGGGSGTRATNHSGRGKHSAPGGHGPAKAHHGKPGKAKGHHK
jgi:hypothetical protein